ncbi:MAG: hypothetical protein WAW41_15740 [Methylobacter sp.]
MSKLPESIPKQPELKAAEDYYRLRREGIGFIEKMASSLWTDYNTHDPGITILEALCFTITDLAYRANWDIKDLLSHKQLATDPNQPFPKQAFFTASKILTVNPVTPDDFRRLLIDRPEVRNAWVFCKECACDVLYYAWCEQNQLTLSYQKPAQEDLSSKKIEPFGLYEILLELENDSELGDLNDRKIIQSYTIEVGGQIQSYMLELRFPEWGLLEQDKFAAFITSTAPHLTITLGKFSNNKVDNNFISESDLQRFWRNVFYISFSFSAGGQTIVINNVSLRIFCDASVINKLTINQLTSNLCAGTPSDFLQKYRCKLKKSADQIVDAKATLHKHRNLDEDFCRVNAVNIEDIAVCADVEVAADADIERVQARIWFEIENYFNPPVLFYTLQELIDSNTPVEAIFNGPALSCGFIKAEELEAAGLKTVLRTSDIINQLMNIEGVVAVNNLLLSKYDAEGNVVKGEVDPKIHDSGELEFDSNKVSASWLLYVKEKHQPRLYHNLSRFLFFKNGLPFLPRMDEAYQTLTQLRGEAERPKNKNTLLDLPIPSGTFRHPEDYFPLQYSFPLTYGIGSAGLPAGASPERKAQAKQLKAYLMVFEQLLANALAQLAHTEQLFSLDFSIERTYFVKELTNQLIKGYDDVINGLDKTKLELIAETPPEFHERRNRFLNHLMARFGEQFGEYALLLTNYKGQKVALDRLIEDKISFLKAYPLISHDRSKAFNYTENPCAPDNFSGLKKRVSLLLGYPNLTFAWEILKTSQGHYKATFQLMIQNETSWLNGKFTLPAHTKDVASKQAYQELMLRIIQPEAYKIVKQTGYFKLKLTDEHHKLIAQAPSEFASKTAAIEFRDELIGWAANERAIVVEHLLLRPKFPGDALYPVCTDGSCNLCGDEDPYSFRLTFVMPGWTAPYNTNLELRRFADRTIRQETPAHLLPKICWIDNTGFEPNPCGEPILATIAELLETNPGTVYTREQACDCAWTLFNKYSDDFKPWFDERKTNHWLKTTWELKITDLLKDIKKTDFNCTQSVSDATWGNIHAELLAYFTDIALHGWQFERFEKAFSQWLEANVNIDWTEVHLQDRVLAILEAGLDLAKPLPSKEQLCNCTAKIIGEYATKFYLWMQTNISAGTTLEELGAKKLPELKIEDCSSLSLSDANATKQKLTDLLVGKQGLYTGWVEVSYRLWIVVDLLSHLRNTYPGATLHDCDDGSDQNPVRLGSTALGNYPLRSSAI